MTGAFCPGHDRETRHVVTPHCVTCECFQLLVAESGLARYVHRY